ncbi:MAG: hypothetical protein AAF218_05470 [Pseudomonadota bacterium]
MLRKTDALLLAVFLGLVVLGFGSLQNQAFGLQIPPRMIFGVT